MSRLTQLASLRKRAPQHRCVIAGCYTIGIQWGLVRERFFDWHNQY
jgi:hypothetical protein